MTAILHLFLHFFYGIAFATVTIGTGLIALRSLNTDGSPEVRYLIAFGLGGLVWSLIVFILSAFSLLYPSVIAGSFVAGAAGVWSQRRSFLPVPILKFSALSKTEKILLVFLLLHLSFSALMTALPPTDNDGVAYHLAVPKIYLQHHSFVYLPSIFHSNWPFLSEMLYTLGLAVDPDGTVAVLMHYFAGVVCALLLYELTRPILMHRSSRMIAVLLFLTLTTVRLEITTPYIDLFTAMYILLSWMIALRLRTRVNIDDVILLALFIGAAASTKLTAPVFCLIIPFFAFFSSASSLSLRTRIKYMVTVGVISFLIVLPWYVRSFIFTGNPFWPFAYSVFGGKFLDQDYARTIAVYFTQFSPLQGILGFFRLPIEFIQGKMFVYSPSYLFAAAVTCIATIPFTWKKVTKTVFVTALFILWGVIVWYSTTQQVRFLIPFLGLTCIAVVFQYEQLVQLNGWKRYLGYIIALFMVIPIVHRVPLTNLSDFRNIGVLVGSIDREEFLAGFHPYAVSNFLNTELTSGQRVALIGEVRGFYIEKDYVWTGFNSVLYLDLNRCEADRIEEKLRLEGISHLAVRDENLEKELKLPALRAIQSLMQRSTMVYHDRWYSVVQLPE